MTEQRQRLDTPQRQVLEKAEVLLLDGDDASRDACTADLAAAGIIVTAMSDDTRALGLAREKHFSGILVDADTPRAGEGLELVPRFISASPASAVALLCGQPSFETAVAGFRKGALDVLAKVAGQRAYLVERLVALCLEAQRASARDQLLRETLEVHDLFLKRLMEASRRAEAAEELAAGNPDSSLSAECVVLVVDENTRTAEGLQQALGGTPFRCVPALNGGEALDYATAEKFDIALVKETLPDLPGSTIAKTLRSQTKEGVVLLFAHPGKRPGFVSIVETSQNIDLIPELTAPGPLVERLREFREAFAAKSREKRYLNSFRQTHGDFLRRFVEVRQKIQKLLPGRKP